MEVAGEAGGTGEAADGARASGAAEDRAVQRVPTRQATDARRDRRAPARPGARRRSVRRAPTQGA